MPINILSRNRTISFTNIRKGIKASFTIAALFSVFLVLCIGFFINERKNDSGIINMAGRQRMLGQKLATDIHLTGSDGRALAETENDAELWDSIHNALRYGNLELGVRKSENPEIIRLFEEISPYQQKLYLASLSTGPARPGGPVYGDIRRWNDRYQAGMDRIVDELQADAERGMSVLKYIVAFLISLFLLLIFGLYRILVKPIIKIVKTLSDEREERAEQIRSILENTSDLIWSLDLDRKLLSFNSAFSKAILEQTGTAPVIGSPILRDPYPEEILRKWESMYEKAFSGRSFSTEIRSDREDGTSYIEVSLNPIYGPQGRVTGCNVFSRDVTERAETYKKLARSEKYLKEAQRIANLGNWNWDMASNGIYWSDQLYQVFGQDPETFRPDYGSFLEIIHPEDREAFTEDVDNCIENGAPLDIVHRIVMGDGGIRYVHQRGRTHYHRGRPVRMAGTSQDVTGLENARLRIMRQYNELENFVYIISHNIRAPISTLQGLVDIFEPGNAASNVQVIDYIGSTVDTLDRTIKDLNHALSLKDISEDTFGKVDLEEVVRDICDLLARDIKVSGARIDHDFSRAPDAFGVRSYFTNILYNLVLNSITHKVDERDPYISIRSRRTAMKGTEIVVSDNGKGMALTEGAHKKIFDMYGRLSGKSEGRGMGLYLVRTQVETMKGSINVRSEPGKGSIFTIVFDSIHEPQS
ncbi:PAS domain-containing protein [Pricia sp. S334]|uniref:histidine kinase n=1 Tax=Pricia mediterranea TaxID=3076079 RepID=A0ABU3L3U8_9FLAO|nr:PAS domain-containing protein [Pricia sp. S334]MDT7827986.1 PAS domain-containing protein [Pricia sp. S334]